MDKAEYISKLEEINTLAEAGRFKEAASAADQIDWRHVKSVRTLSMIGEIYEANKRYEDSCRILKLAYRRSSSSKAVLYRLTELSLRTGRIDEAKKYLNEFEQVSPNDNSRHILHYRLLKAERAPLDDQIEALNEYKKHEYTERWAYELARLYRRNGQNEKCVEECDDMILWFSEGRYVMKAMELKMQLEPLSPLQQARYDECVRIAEEEKQRKAEAGAASVSETADEGGSHEEVQPDTETASDEAVQEDAEEGSEEESATGKSGEWSIADPQVAEMTEAASGRGGKKQSGFVGSLLELFEGVTQRFTHKSEEEEGPAADSVMSADVLGQPEAPAEEASVEEDTGISDEDEDMKIAEGREAESLRVRDLEEESAAAGTIIKKTTSPEAAEEPVSEEQQVRDEIEDALKDSDETIDLDRLFAETAGALAQEVASGAYELADTLERDRQTDRTAAPEEDAVSGESLAEQIEAAVRATEEARKSEHEQPEEPEPEAAETTAPEVQPLEEETVPEAPAIVETAAEETAENGKKPEETPAAAPQEDTPAAAAERALAAAIEEMAAGFREEELKEAEEQDPAEATDAVRDDESSDGEQPATSASAKETPADTTSVEEQPADAELPEESAAAAEGIGNSDEELPEEQVFAGDEDWLDERVFENGAGEAFAEKTEEAEAEESAAEEPETGYRMAERETDESLGLTREFHFSDEIEKALAARRLQKEEEGTEEEPIRSPEEAALADVAEALGTSGEEKEPEESAEEAVPEEQSAEAEASPLAEVFAEQDGVEETAVDEVLLERYGSEELPEEEKLPEEQSGEDLLNLGKESSEEQLLEQYAEDPTVMEHMEVAGRRFTEEEEKAFSYFAAIPGIDYQVTMALADVHNNSGDKTSRSGNIAISGRPGSGKTRLGDALILTICMNLNIRAVKAAKIVAEDFNKKDPAAIVKKLAGGFLTIEAAGALTPAAAERLSKAMEFRTDSLVVILEDEKQELQKLFSAHPDLAAKFTSRINVPVFTNDELVTFGKVYAKDIGYKMDEMATLALYTMIGDNQKDAEPVTVSMVKEMIDKAAERSSRKFRFGKNSDKEDGMTVLHEKDFNF